jgi:hypothetical protein
MPNELDEKILKLKMMIENRFAECRERLKVLSCMPEDDPDINLVIQTPFRDLPKLINDYDEGSIQHKLLKYRLDNRVEICDNSILDIGIVGIFVVELLQDCDGEDATEVQTIRNTIDDLRTISKIFGFQSILEDLTIWRP